MKYGKQGKLFILFALIIFVNLIIIGCGPSDDPESVGEVSVVDLFNGQIIGIDPGAGVMDMAETALDKYGLTDAGYELVEGSDATMAAELDRAITNNEWVVVTGWAPHWKFGKYDLKILDDPLGVFGEEETINNIVRLGLQDDMPEVYELLDNHFWTGEDLSAAMAIAEESESAEAAAAQWISENQVLVETWLPINFDAEANAGQEVTLLYVEWACASATTHIIADILENIMGYSVEIMPVSASAMYTGLATGVGDAMVAAWLPSTHSDYMKQYNYQVEDLGPSMEGAVLGLVVPEYVKIDSIEEMIN
ncbi:Glycine betaine ABC transporter, substrate-binding protein OtaC [Candidatus Syntrophocurvum alkaliphilum]|uniref:Glycine betaine ABC transporter, substrate-binding protein OtaC n=1 Tax=Candidatus Syntrophocurvum alkaliphilum TaxID=2293317 RepID=A0A6I6D7A3_9FIRM|nr:glycine betaine ABC transporter substrate-binding protein [Candidatus Syntrophocurvum alkaliphilum]QGT99036.1 Glycine betaine ABC transporter, substrate-binding protein OtaC [Candidatus Syntrophocurvum alkaliphilum]